MLQNLPWRPSQHVEVVEALFEQLIFESHQLNETGRPSANAHSWLNMFAKDINELQAIDEGASLHEYIGARRGIHTFLHDFEAREMFIMIDASQLRAKYFGVCIPPG